MLEAVVRESYAYSIYLFDAAMLVKLVTRAYVNGDAGVNNCWRLLLDQSLASGDFPDA